MYMSAGQEGVEYEYEGEMDEHGRALGEGFAKEIGRDGSRKFHATWLND